MSNNQMILVFSTVVWAIFSYLLIRAIQRGKWKRSRPTGLAWVVFFLGCLILLLTSVNVEARIDSYFGNLPVGLYARSFCILLNAHFFHLALKDIAPSSSALTRWFDLVSPTFIFVGVCSFIVFALWKPISLQELNSTVRIARDTTMLALSMARFMPAMLFILREEKVPPMKVKAGINLTFFITYSFYNVGSIIFNIEMLARNPNALVDEGLLRPIAYVCFCLFILMYVPHKWLLFLFYPRRFYAYYRLRQLDASILQILYDGKGPVRVPVRPPLPGELELAIYRTTISILDRHTLIRSHAQGKAIYMRIRQLLATEPQYADLIAGLMSIR